MTVVTFLEILGLQICFLFLVQHMKTTGSHCHRVHDILYQVRVLEKVFRCHLFLFSQTMNTGYSQRLLFVDKCDENRCLWSDILLHR